MAFPTAPTSTIQEVDSGELGDSSHIILSSVLFQDELTVGRFCKLDTGSIDKLDGSATPSIVGVVLRNKAMSVEDGDTIDSTLNHIVNYVTQGLVTVAVKAGETPAVHGRVYVSNAGDANDGLATATNTDVVVNAEFIREIKTGVWEIYITPASGDLVAHMADATGAHAASAISILDAATVFTGVNVETVTNELYDKIQDHEDDAAAAHAASAVSLLDTAGYTTETEVEAAIAELYLQRQKRPVADPGDGLAIPVTASFSCAITSGGVETRTVAIPTYLGQELDLCFDVDGGDCTITFASAINVTGNNTALFETARQALHLVSTQIAGVLAWEVAANIGTVTLTTV